MLHVTGDTWHLPVVGGMLGLVVVLDVVGAHEAHRGHRDYEQQEAAPQPWPQLVDGRIDSSPILLSMYKDIYKIKRRHTLTENANRHILWSLYIDARIGKDASC